MSIHFLFSVTNIYFNMLHGSVYLCMFTTVILSCTQITSGGSNRTDQQVSDLRKMQEQKMKRAKTQRRVCGIAVIPVVFIQLFHIHADR